MHIWHRGRTVSEKCPDHQSWHPNGGWERLERKDKGSQEGHSGQVGRMFVSNRHQVQQGSEETTEGGYRWFWEECERTYEWGPPGMNADKFWALMTLIRWRWLTRYPSLLVFFVFVAQSGLPWGSQTAFLSITTSLCLPFCCGGSSPTPGTSTSCSCLVK